MSPTAAAPRIQADRRRHRRIDVCLDACLDGGGQLIPCVIVDASEGGVQVLAEVDAGLDRLRLDIEAYGAFECRVMWSNGTRAGLAFVEDPLLTSTRLAGLLRGA